MARQVEKFEQVNVSLPPGLFAFLQRKAAAQDQTLSGMIRHLVAQAARIEPPPLHKPPPLPNVPADLSIENARDEIARMSVEEARLGRLGFNATASTDARRYDLKNRIRWLESQIELAERMLPASRNGVPHGR